MYSKLYNDPRLLFHKIPERFKSVTAPMLAIQATCFKCGGLPSFSHISFPRFCGRFFREYLPSFPDFHLAYLFPTNIFPMMLQPSILKLAAKTVVNKQWRGNFVAKAKVIASSSSGDNRRISKVAIVAATIWRALICISRAKNAFEAFCESLMLSLRGRVGMVEMFTFEYLFGFLRTRTRSSSNI